MNRRQVLIPTLREALAVSADYRHPGSKRTTVAGILN